ncbi:hypothetical protein ACT1UH_03090 [Mycoplasma sp. 332]|uniref:hypothetical protein n=1 Tax=unclassified Asterococcus (in: mycoplasmas, genus) TaxID=3407551 RepID=UPI003F65C8E7
MKKWLRKKSNQLQIISKSELNDLNEIIEDAKEQIANLSENKADVDNASEYEALIKEYEDLKTKNEQRKTKVEELLNYKPDKSEFPSQIAELEQEKTDANTQVEQIKMDLQEKIIDKKNAEELIKIFEKNEIEIDERIDLYKRLSVANLVIKYIDNQIEGLMKNKTISSTNDDSNETLSMELKQKKDNLYRLREKIKDLIAKVFQEEIEISKYL